MFAVVIFAVVNAYTPSDVVQTEGGPVQGMIVGNVSKFLGVPFAAPPMGLRRFKQLVLVEPWTKVRNCSEPGNLCPQREVSEAATYKGVEDCMNLNVYTPKDAREDVAKNGLLPVMVWIHGGGWVEGNSYDDGLYDGQHIVSQHGYILVAANYRLGPLGFMALDELAQESEVGTTGNYGLQDQQFALEWVQRNIKNFGGDPKRVTLAGESAGSFSVCWHLVNKVNKQKQLFSAVLMESGSCDSSFFYVNMSDAINFSKLMARQYYNCSADSGVELLACLRITSSYDLVNSIPFFAPEIVLPGEYYSPLFPVMPFGAAIDGSVAGLTGIPTVLISNGDWMDVPVLAGTNLNEGSIFIWMIPFQLPSLSLPLTKEGFYLTLHHFFEDDALVQEIAEQYPLQTQDDTYDNEAEIILTDYFFLCSTRRTVRSVNDNGNVAYIYRFDYQGDFIADDFLGDYHTAELEFVFDNPKAKHKWTLNDTEISQVIGKYWANHILYNDPNGPAESPNVNFTWPAWDDVTERHLILELPLSSQAYLNMGRCKFWDGVQAKYGI